jgi:hypothetical protein
MCVCVSIAYKHCYQRSLVFSSLYITTYDSFSWPLWHWVHPTPLPLSLPPTHKNGNYCICQPSCVVLRLWQTTSMSYAMSQNLLRPLSKSSNKWNPNPIMNVSCVSMIPTSFFAQTFQGFKSTPNFVKRAAWWLLLMLLSWLLLSMSMAMAQPSPAQHLSCGHSRVGKSSLSIILTDNSINCTSWPICIQSSWRQERVWF